MQKKYLSISIGVVFVFIATMLYYIVSNIYLGIFPIGIITGICILLQITMLFYCLKNILINGCELKNVIALSIEVCSVIVMGYFFIIWLMAI